MGKFKFFYFVSKGCGQLICLLLYIVGVDFDDVKVIFKEWKDIKVSKVYQILLFYIIF